MGQSWAPHGLKGPKDGNGGGNLRERSLKSSRPGVTHLNLFPPQITRVVHTKRPRCLLKKAKIVSNLAKKIHLARTGILKNIFLKSSASGKVGSYQTCWVVSFYWKSMVRGGAKDP
jgi:hypothetical protein